MELKDQKYLSWCIPRIQTSPSQVVKEVDRAVHHGLAIIPLRLEDVPMSKQLEYYVSNLHWMDALTPLSRNTSRNCAG